MCKPVEVIVEKTHECAVIPTKGSSEAACFDVYSVEDKRVCPGSVTVVKTGIKMKIPTGYMIHVVPRSGLAFKNGIFVLGGIIDSDYRGEIMIMLSCALKQETISDGIGMRHILDETFISVGDRIAQLQVIPVPQVSMIEGSVDIDTERGEGGFGSTGE